MTDETKIVLVLGSISILLCSWAYYHCFERQREKYEALKKAFCEEKGLPEDFIKHGYWKFDNKETPDFIKGILEKEKKPFKSIFLIDGPIPGVTVEKPAKRPRLYKQATVVTKGELPRKAPVKTVAKKVAKKTTTTKVKK